MMDALIEPDIVEPVEGDTDQKRMRARWKQGYKTGATAERKRIRELIKQLESDGLVEVKQLMWGIDVSH